MTAKFQLQLITEPRGSARQLLALVQGSLEGGITWVQLRDKHASALALYEQACALRRLTRDYGARLFVNDRLDVALACEADGVHLAGQSLPVEAVRRMAGPNLLVGRSVHSLPEAVAAAESGADYLTYGHIFPTGSKQGLPPRGPASLREIVETVQVPVFAIGGIGADNLNSVLATGCAGIAVISAILSAADQAQAARILLDALDASPSQPAHVLPISPSSALEEQLCS